MPIPVIIFFNLVYLEIYGSPHKFAPPLARKKEKRKDIHVKFSDKPIVLNAHELENMATQVVEF
jgi:hypothetical protein